MMYSILLSIILAAAFLFYHSSDKVKFINRPSWLESWGKQKYFIRGFSLLLFAIAALFVIKDQGVGAGSFAFITYIMGAFCVIILLAPYAVFRWYQLVLLFLFCLSVELLAF